MSTPRTKARPSRLPALRPLVALPTPARRRPVPRVFADTSVVTAKSGCVTLVHLVRCPFEDGTFHLHRSPLAFTVGRRKAPCGRGSVELVSGVLGIVRAEAA